MSASGSVVKGNRPLRMFAIGVLIVLAVSHFMGQIDLTKLSFLWLLIFMAVNAIQASFTGFCPMFKNARGECVACGVVCDGDACSPAEEKSSCCSGNTKKESSCCGESAQSSCCSDEPKATSSCCGGDSKETSSCCGSDASCCEGETCIKVLGSGCTNCENTAKLIEKVAEEQGIKVCVCKVEDIAEIAAYGVMSTPGVVINEQVVHSGSVPSAEQVSAWLKSL